MKDIGGYIEFELKEVFEPYHKNALSINCARYGIVYAVDVLNIKKLHVPYYTCPVVIQALKETNCKLYFYNINEELLPVDEFDDNDYILYTNYFGVCDKNIELLEKRYKNLIIDNAQAFYAKPSGIVSIYSPRKFFGVPDGGYIYCNKQSNKEFVQDKDSYKRFSHLLLRIEGGANYGYADFNANEESFAGQGIKAMSNLTSKLLKTIDYQKAKEIRLNNFNYLRKHLDKYNKFKISLNNDVPMYYPLLIENDNLRAELISSNVYIPSCWRGLEDIAETKSYEMYLKKYMHPLIIDQRYAINDMQTIVELAERCLCQ